MQSDCQQPGSDGAVGIIVGSSQAMKDSVQLARKAARSQDTTVLIEGETGTGKELVAKLIHEHGPRKNKPYVCLNCGAISKDLLESELFGYEKGTFTGGLQEGKKGKFELASGGTILLDEISELAPTAQVKLLRVLEERTFYPVGGTELKGVNVRVIALTNRNLEEEIKKGAFRDDLYFRLNVVRISLPALRNRRDDILPIAFYFMNRFNEKFKKNFKTISREAADLLMNHVWTGNVRELRNAMERIILLEDDRTVRPGHLSFLEPGRKACPDEPLEKSNVMPFLMKGAIEHCRQEKPHGIEIPASGISLDELNKKLLLDALHLTGGNRAQAAKLLGISRATAIYRIQKYGIGNKADG